MIVLKNVNLIDGIAENPQMNVTVCIKGNRIVEIGKDVPVAEDALIINLKNKWLLPGFIEAHTHMGGQTEITDPRIPMFGGRGATANYANLREASLNYGITTVRSCGDYAADSLWLKKQISEHRLRGPRVICCGGSFQKEGGHPNATVWGGDPITLEAAAIMPQDSNTARRMVREYISAGVDFIKIIINYLDLLHGKSILPKLEFSIVQAITDEAHNYGKIVAAHCEDIFDARQAVLCGVDDIEHMILPSYISPQNFNFDQYEELLELMAEKGTYFTPTAYVTMLHDKSAMKENYAAMPSVLRAEWEKELYATMPPIFHKAWEKGVKLTMGTDSGAPGISYGVSLHKELELMVKGQNIPPMNVLQAVTRVNAELVGLGNMLGTIEKGKLADVFVVSENPLDDIANTQKIELVIADGHIVKESILFT